MAREKKRDKEHQFLARIDQAIWDRIQALSESWDVSLNDVVNHLLEHGAEAVNAAVKPAELQSG